MVRPIHKKQQNKDIIKNKKHKKNRKELKTTNNFRQTRSVFSTSDDNISNFSDIEERLSSKFEDKLFQYFPYQSPPSHQKRNFTIRFVHSVKASCHWSNRIQIFTNSLESNMSSLKMYTMIIMKLEGTSCIRNARTLLDCSCISEAFWSCHQHVNPFPLFWKSAMAGKAE